MITFDKAPESDHSWQSEFIKLLPRIEHLLNGAFCHLDAEKQEEAVQSGIVHCLLSYMKLHHRGRTNKASASTLVWYAVLQIKCGRPAVGRMNSKEVLSEYGQLRRGFKVIQQAIDDESWINQLADERAPVLDLVAARLDVRSWFNALPVRSRRIAADLARGDTTADAATKHRVTPSRISQIRRQLNDSWMAFQHELAPVA